MTPKKVWDPISKSWVTTLEARENKEAALARGEAIPEPHKTKKSSTWVIILAVVVGIPLFILYAFPEIITKESSSTPTQSKTTTVAASQKTYSFTGSSHKTLKVNLNKGLVIVEIKASCSRKENIAVEFLNGDGSYFKGHIFNELAQNWSGSTSFNIREPDTYIINVEINGNWTLNIK